MAGLSPISRDGLIVRLRDYGYEGPSSGGKHAKMRKGGHTLVIPNPHGSDIGVPLLRRVLRQAEISVEEWLGIP